MGRLDIHIMGLCGKSELAAQDLLKAHPDVVFTSGRRTISEQARAMASNVAKGGRGWIASTYKHSDVSQAAQAWVDAHPTAVTPAQLEVGLLSVFRRFTNHELCALSKHLSGEAFDVQPMPGLAGGLVLQSLRRIVAAYGGKLIEREGGLVVWHAQF